MFAVHQVAADQKGATLALIIPPVSTKVRKLAVVDGPFWIPRHLANLIRNLGRVEPARLFRMRIPAATHACPSVYEGRDNESSAVFLPNLEAVIPVRNYILLGVGTDPTLGTNTLI